MAELTQTKIMKMLIATFGEKKSLKDENGS